MTKLSLIIPCYNCEKTLKETFVSIVNSTLIPDEIIMVDDGSTDNTSLVMNEITSQYHQLTPKVITHDVNRGGGAARNTGIKSAKSEYIFCLDSDNILEKNTLKKLIDTLETNRADGAVIHERRFFNKRMSRYSSHFNKIIDIPLKIEDLFDESNTLLDNFLYKKSAWEKSGGYPEHHGFDTQCFEVRFLSRGHKALVSKDSVFYHRQVGNSPSYYEREYNKGNFSKNYYLIIEEILNLFSDDAINTIYNFDIFSKNSNRDNLLILLKTLSKENKLFGKRTDQIPYLLKFTQAFLEHDFEKSWEIIKTSKTITPIDQLNLLRTTIGLQKKDFIEIHKQLDEELAKITNKTSPTLYKWYHRLPILSELIEIVYHRKNRQ